MTSIDTNSLRNAANQGNFDKLLDSLTREQVKVAYNLVSNYIAANDISGVWGPLQKAADRGDYSCYPPKGEDFRKIHQDLMNIFLSQYRVDRYLQLYFLLNYDLVLKYDDNENLIFSWE